MTPNVTMRPALGRGQPLPAGGDKGSGVAHDMIGGQRQNDRLALARLRKGGTCRNRRSGIAPHRLQQDIGLDADLGELLQHHEAIGGVGDHDRPLEQRRVGDPQQRVLKGRARSEQRQELFRMNLARGRPQPRSGAAAHDQWDNSPVHRLLEFARRPFRGLFTRRPAGAAIPRQPAIARTAPKPYQGGQNPARGPLGPRVLVIPLKQSKTRTMRRILLSSLKILVSAALLYLALRKVDFHELASRFNVASLGWIGAGDRGDLPADFPRRAALARGQRRMRRAARRHAGDPLQPDRRVLQSDAALLDRRRRGAAVAGGARRRRLARGDLFDLRRPRDRPDRARDRDRGEPALELSADRRPERPLGAAAGRFRGACRPASDFWCSAGCHGRG